MDARLSRYIILGVVSAALVGIPWISACGDGATEPPGVSPFSISPDSVFLTSLGEMVAFTTTTLRHDGNPFAVAVTWSSDDTSVVTVNQDGVATAVSAGSTTIRAVSGAFHATADVSVATTVATSVCDRTPQVRDAITAAAGRSDCAQVTARDLEGITSLDLSGPESASAATAAARCEAGTRGELASFDFQRLAKRPQLEHDVGTCLSLQPEHYFSEPTGQSNATNDTTVIADLQTGDFQGLANLQLLNLTRNALKTLPENVLDGLTELDTLYLADNSLTALPNGVFNDLVDLTNLQLGINSLTALPDGVFDNLDELELLSLSRNELTELPDGIFDDLEDLELLWLYSNEITELPDGVFDELDDLELLWLHSNEITELPDGVFDDLEDLESLALSVNRITEIPEGVFDNLDELLALYLNSNQLSLLPEGIFAELHNLRLLNLYNNQLTALPGGIFAGLGDLVLLWLDGNPGDPFPFVLELVNSQTDPLDIALLLAEGAPFDITVELEAQGGSLLADSATIAAGDTIGNVVTVTPDAVGTVSVAVASVPAMPTNECYGYPCFDGFEVVAGDPLVLMSEPDSTPPAVVIQAPTTEEVFSTTAAEVTLSGMSFDDLGVISVRWEVSDSLSGFATGTSQWTLGPIPLEVGDTEVVVTAVDAAGNQGNDVIRFTRNRAVAFLGPPRFDPSVLQVGVATDIRAAVAISSSDDLNVSSVTLAEVTEQGVEVGRSWSLYDDGESGHGDDTRGDGIFSNVISVLGEADGFLNYQATVVVTQSDGSTVEDRSPVGVLPIAVPATTQQVDMVVEIQDSALATANQDYGVTGDLMSAMAAAEQFFKDDSNVAVVRRSGNTGIAVEYANGLAGGIIFPHVDEAGTTITRGSQTSGFTNLTRAAGSGSLLTPSHASWMERADLGVRSDPPAGRILSKRVMVWAPYDAEFSPYSEADSIARILMSDTLGLELDLFKNEAATIDVLRRMTDYGMVVLETHGYGGEWIITKEKVTDEAVEMYWFEIGSGQIGTWAVAGVTEGAITRPAKVLSVNSNFLGQLSGRFPQSVIINNSCEGTHTSAPELPSPFFPGHLAHTFFSRGAQTYYGYNRIVGSQFAMSRAIEVVSRLADGMTTGEAFTPNQIDPWSADTAQAAVFQMLGSPDMQFKDDRSGGTSIFRDDFTSQASLEEWEVKQYPDGGGTAKVVDGSLQLRPAPSGFAHVGVSRPERGRLPIGTFSSWEVRAAFGRGNNVGGASITVFAAVGRPVYAAVRFQDRKREDEVTNWWAEAGFYGSGMESVRGFSGEVTDGAVTEIAIKYENERITIMIGSSVVLETAVWMRDLASVALHAGNFSEEDGVNAVGVFDWVEVRGTAAVGGPPR